MPTYCYKHPETGEVIEQVMPIDEMVALKAVGGLIVDGVLWKRDLVSENCGRRMPGEWPLKSDAAGVHPSQAMEAMKNASGKGVATEFDKSTGQAIFRDRSHRKAYLRAMGMHDRNGGYGD